jgi:hypothetical protein
LALKLNHWGSSEKLERKWTHDHHRPGPEKQTHQAGRNDKIRIERELPDPKARAQRVRDVLRSLGTPKVEVAA